jgi:peptidoglycan biosynthesis protein MviN/MurJ (putative lipid II flippase)
MSIAVSLSPPACTRANRTCTGSSAWLVAGLAVFSALPLSFGVLRLLQLAGLSDVMPPASAAAIPLVSHIVGALAYTLLGAVQLSPVIRRRWPAWHRVAGRLALVGAALVVGSALWLTASYATPTVGGLVLAAFRLAVASAMATAIALGLAAIPRREIARHREWMIRAYALGLGAATQMLVLMVAEMISSGAPTDLNRALLMGLAWGINLIVAEWSIRRGRGAR